MAPRNQARRVGAEKSMGKAVSMGRGRGRRQGKGSGGGNGSGGNRWSGAIAMRLLSLYGKTQRGTAYDQLNDGARALDLRPIGI